MSDSIAMSVLGPIATSELGMTLMHEHVFNDCSCWWRGHESGYQSDMMHKKVDSSMQKELTEDPF